MDCYTSPNGASIALNLSPYNIVLLNIFFFLVFSDSFDLLMENPNDETFIPLNCVKVVCYLSCLQQVHWSCLKIQRVNYYFCTNNCPVLIGLIHS